MTAHLLRRTIVIIPTVIGVSFLVFMLVALSPGGLAPPAHHDLTLSGASGAERIYFEDRYGLDDPALVQYARWLSRISPVRFGPALVADEDGRPVYPPRPLPPPPVAGPGPAAGPAPEIDAGRTLADLRTAYARDRAEYLIAREELHRASKPRAEAEEHPPARAALAEAAQRATDAYERERASRAALSRYLSEAPLPVRGVVLIPGVLSLVPPDLGESFQKGRPVSSLIASALPVTLLINALALLVALAAAVPTGYLAAARAGTLFDRAAGIALVALWSFPVALAAVLAVGLLAGPSGLGLFPIAGLHGPQAAEMTFLPDPSAPHGLRRGWLLDAAWHLCLPVACLAITGIAVFSRQLRAAMLENMHADHVRAATARGLPRSAVLSRHVLRNSLLPLITLLAAVVPALLSGSIVVERVFAIPGMGSLVLDAVLTRDREVLMASVLIVSVASALALLAADVLYALADPRTRIPPRTR